MTTSTAYYPVEIDNKYFYDFIASTTEYSDTESIQTFYQVLDPPFVKMMEEITNKPEAYVEGIFESKMLFSDLRQNQRSTSLFATDMETYGMAGVTHSEQTRSDLMQVNLLAITTVALLDLTM